MELLKQWALESRGGAARISTGVVKPMASYVRADLDAAFAFAEDRYERASEMTLSIAGSSDHHEVSSLEEVWEITDPGGIASLIGHAALYEPRFQSGSEVDLGTVTFMFHYSRGLELSFDIDYLRPAAEISAQLTRVRLEALAFIQNVKGEVSWVTTPGNLGRPTARDEASIVLVSNAWMFGHQGGFSPAERQRIHESGLVLETIGDLEIASLGASPFASLDARTAMTELMEKYLPPRPDGPRPTGKTMKFFNGRLDGGEELSPELSEFSATMNGSL